MDDVLPLLVGRLARASDAAEVIEAALAKGVAHVALDDGPSYRGAHVLVLHVADWPEPLVLRAEPAGVPAAGCFPLRLAPSSAGQEDALLALLFDLGLAMNRGAPASAPPGGALPSAPIDPVALATTLPASERTAPGGLEGRVIGGKYTIETLLGSGGMGSIYRATHIGLEKAFAIKVLHATLQHDDELAALFHREALAASRLDHPNVVQVLDFGAEPDGTLYIAMELLAGVNLREVLQRQPVQPLERIVAVMSQACAALVASHDKGVVHRDMKPENIVLVAKPDDSGAVHEVVKVCDFGIADILGRKSAARPGAVDKSSILGTPDYMSPEQILGGEVDARSDVYACGVILYEMATGKVPFHADATTDEIAWSHVHRAVPAPQVLLPSIDHGLAALIRKALSKDPAARHPSARALRGEILGLQERARRDARLQAFNDTDAIPEDLVPSFARDDAIDIDDLLSVGTAPAGKAGSFKEQIWMLAERMATQLVEDAGAVLGRIDAAQDLASYARELATLERAMAALATRGDAPALAAAVAHLAARAQGAEPGEGTREALAARALRTLEEPERLLRTAEQALDGPTAAREPARKVLVTLGGAGAHALCLARERAGVHGPSWAGRPRFVAAAHEIGPAALPILAAFEQQVDPRDAALLEDLLRAVTAPTGGEGRAPPPLIERLGATLTTRHLRHEAPGVRRAAAVALASLWGPRANPWLAPLLEDADDGLRIAAIHALRKHAGVDPEVVRRLGRILSWTSPAGTELRVAAAAALADTTGPARALAVEALSQAIRPADKGFFSRLVTAPWYEDPAVVTTMARTLLALGGADAARLIEARAARTGAELRRQLLDLLAAEPARPKKG